jgi:hypothetical protein
MTRRQPGGRESETEERKVNRTFVCAFVLAIISTATFSQESEIKTRQVVWLLANGYELRALSDYLWVMQKEKNHAYACKGFNASALDLPTLALRLANVYCTRIRASD